MNSGVKIYEQYIIDLGAEEENGKWQQGIIEAIRVSNG